MRNRMVNHAFKFITCVKMFHFGILQAKLIHPVAALFFYRTEPFSNLIEISLEQTCFMKIGQKM